MGPFLVSRSMNKDGKKKFNILVEVGPGSQIRNLIPDKDMVLTALLGLSCLVRPKPTPSKPSPVASSPVSQGKRG
jgi:hypothetical protein